MQTMTSQLTPVKATVVTRSQRLNRIGTVLIGLAIALGFITRVVAVFQYITFDIGPDPDQIRDAFIVMNMWKGEWPSLGPAAFGAGLGGFHIFPLYYYLCFPFTLLGANPAIQAFPNALFSFLSIPLFIYLTYQLLENIPPAKRLFLSGLAGFWYSLLFGDIFLSNFQWNPSSIPFFFMIFTALYNHQMKALTAREALWPRQYLAWIGSGFTLAILMSLHASALFIMPVVYIIISIRFAFKVLKKRRSRKYLIFPGLGIFAAMLALSPYWVGGWANGWAGGLQKHVHNTRAIVTTVLSTATDDETTPFFISLLEKLGISLLHALNTLRQAYFWNASASYAIISVAVIALIATIAFSTFKGNSNIWLVCLSTWGLFLLAVTNFSPNETNFYYKVLFLSAPIVLTVVALAYVELSGKKAIAYSIAIALFITLSGANNLYHDAQFMAAKYGPNRVMSTQDIIDVMRQLPNNAVICDPRIARKRKLTNQYNYIDTYITHKEITAKSTCKAGAYIIHPKRILNIAGNFLNTQNYRAIYPLKRETPRPLELWPVLKTEKNGPIARSARLIMEKPTSNVYQLF